MVREAGGQPQKAIIQTILELANKYKLNDLLKLAGLPRSTFYYQKKCLSKIDKYSKEKEIIKQIFDENRGRYGYRRISLEMRKRGYLINHKTVQKLMKVCGIKCQVRIVKYRSYKDKLGKIAPNLIDRNFYAQKPNQKWTTDVTQFSLHSEKLYLSPILDMYNGEIISYNVSSASNFNQTIDMLEKAFSKVPDGTNLILHSDQGWQYQMKQYQAMLDKKGIRQSMSRKGNCLDNSVMENFFGLLKSELLYLETFESMEKFKIELEKYIDYYNNKRLKSKLKGLSPVQYRIQSLLVS